MIYELVKTVNDSQYVIDKSSSLSVLDETIQRLESMLSEKEKMKTHFHIRPEAEQKYSSYGDWRDIYG